mgnify:CR=1 FL=1
MAAIWPGRDVARVENERPVHRRPIPAGLDVPTRGYSAGISGNAGISPGKMAALNEGGEDSQSSRT